MTDKNLIRIAALLRKAEGTNNEHEADAYMQAAQRLATLDSVDLAVARGHTARGEKPATPVQRTITIGDQGKRGLRRYVRLMLAIGRANDITCDIAHDSTRVYAYGFEADIDAAEALYASLVVQMVRASDAYLKSDERRSETVERYNRRTGMWEDQVVHGTVARNNFMDGFAARIGERLSADVQLPVRGVRDEIDALYRAECTTPLHVAAILHHGEQLATGDEELVEAWERHLDRIGDLDHGKG